MADLIAMLSAAAGVDGGAAADPNFNQTTLLLHGDGTNGAQNNTFLDSSTNTFTITRNGNTTQGTFSPFSVAAGEWSNYFDSATPRYITAPNLAPGTNNFSIECWYYATALPQQFTALAGQDNSAVNGTWTWRVNSNDNYQLTFVYYNGGFIQINSSATYNPNNGGWYHCLVTRDGTDLRMFMDGVLAAHGTLPGSFNFSGNSANLFIGRAERDSGNINGYISNFRYVRGSIPTAYQTASTTPGTTVFTPPTNSLTAITDTILLTCQSNRFVDNSASPQTITSVSSSVQPFSPFAPSAAYSPSVNGGSGYFDGSGDYLSVANDSALTITNNAFTLEAWVYPTTISGSYQSIAGVWNSTDGLQWITQYNNSEVRIFIYNGGFTQFSGAVTVTANQWYHIVIQRDGSNTGSIYVNGTRIANSSYTNTGFASTADLNIGRNGDNSEYVTGYISGFKFVKNSAIYSGTTITVPTAPPTDESGTELLCNFTNAGIFDNTGKNNLETVGNAQIDTSVKKYGTGSMEFDGTGDYLVLNQANPDLYAFGTGDFTIECWLYTTNVSQQVSIFYDGRPSGTNAAQPTLYLNFSNIYYFTQGGDRITGESLSTNTWYHIAVSRQGTSTKLFVNGTQTGSTYTDTNNYTNTVNRPIFGTSGSSVGNNYFYGYIDDLRITKGVARYTAAFTPPTAAFPDL